MAAPSINDLIKEISAGSLILPEFQRGYVWKREKVKDYVRSLYRKYPTGHFLIWKTFKPQQSRGSNPQSDNTYWRLILDGQQRLTSIYTLFQGKPPAFYEGETLYFNLYFNVAEEEFEFYHASKMAENPLWIEITPFLKKGINEWLSDLEQLPSDLRDVYLKHLARFNKLDAIRSYTYHLDEVIDKPVKEIVDIFNLVNSSGTTLSSADLALARICVAWPEARQTLKAAQEHFEAAGFSFKLEFFTRCISALAVGNVYFEAGFDDVQRSVLEDAWERAEKTLEYLVNILRNDAFIDSSESFSSPYVLVPMLVHLSKRGGVFKNDAEKHWFLYWMYVALMWGRYSVSTDTNLQADVNALQSEDVQDALLANIKQQRGRLTVEPEDLEGQGVNSRFYPITYIVARSRGAVDWFTGVKLYNSNVGKSYGLEDHHIFPLAVLRKNGYKSSERKDKKLMNEIANRAFLTKKANLRAASSLPLKYLPEVKAKFAKALAQQFVPQNAALWEVANYQAFLTERRKQIAASINSFLESLLTENEQPKPFDEQIRALVASGESETVEFKSSLRWDYVNSAKNKELEFVILKSIAGFLNGKGGTLLMGISPKGEILGLQNDYSTFSKEQNRDGFEQKLTNLISNHVGKEFVPFINITFVAMDGKDVCWVKVEPSYKPVYVEQGDQFKFYVRLGNATHPMNPKEMTEYVTMRWSPAIGMGAKVNQ